MKLNLDIGPLGPDGTIKLQAFVALALQGEQGIQGPQGEQGPGIAPDDPRLTDAREWTAATVDQAEAEAGAATTRRAWTAQRVRQAMLGWWGGFAAKATPVNADSIVIADSAASNAPKRLTWANAVAKLRGTFVEGPASAVDGQVMLFNGTSGTLAKTPAIGSATNISIDSQPYYNTLADNGRYCASGENNASGLYGAAFSATRSYYAVLHNGATYSNSYLASSNSVTTGGVGPAWAPAIVDLKTAMNLPFRYFAEFYVAEITQGASPSIGGTPWSGNTYYTVGYPAVASAYYSANGYMSVGFWVKALDTGVLIRTGGLTHYRLKNMSNPPTFPFLITPADGWTHVAICCKVSGSTSYINEILQTNLMPGERLLIALPYCVAGVMPIERLPHIQPIFKYALNA